MLLALTGRMPEALLALSNAIDVAKAKPTDDPLALARAYDAMGRTLLEIRESPQGIATLQNAVNEFKLHGIVGQKEALAAQRLIDQNKT